MRSKWEYIRDACRELGYEEAAWIADEIERVLKDIYGDTKTCKWMRDYMDVKGTLYKAELLRVATSSMYCIGCMEDIDCETCRFNTVTGGLQPGSLYSRFNTALYNKR